MAIPEAYCDMASVQLIKGRPEIVLVHFGADDPENRVIPVGLIVEGCLEIYPSAARRLVIDPRVLRMIAEAIDSWESSAQKLRG